MTRGRLIAFEGGEASGKTTQAAMLARRLDAVLTREPGATDLGRRIRRLVLDERDISIGSRAEALLLAADRAQHVEEVVEPALESGRDVVTDRFTSSTLAYQGHGRGLDVDELTRLCSWAAAGVAADLVVLLDIAPGEARSRRGRASDRMEDEDEGFHTRVAEGYLAMARAEPDRWAVVDGRGPVREVAERVLAAFDGWAQGAEAR